MHEFNAAVDGGLQLLEHLAQLREVCKARQQLFAKPGDGMGQVHGVRAANAQLYGGVLALVFDAVFKGFDGCLKLIGAFLHALDILCQFGGGQVVFYGIKRGLCAGV